MGDIEAAKEGEERLLPSDVNPTRRYHHRKAVRHYWIRAVAYAAAIMGLVASGFLIVIAGDQHIPKLALGLVASIPVAAIGVSVLCAVPESRWADTRGPPYVVYVHRRKYADGTHDAWASWYAVDLDRSKTSRAQVVGVVTTAYVNPDHDEWWGTPCHWSDAGSARPSPPSVETAETYQRK